MRPQAGPAIAEDLAGVFAGARGLLSNMLDLLTLEARRAGVTLVLMAACGAVGAILVVAAWLGFMALLALALVAHGASWEAALVLISGANLGLAAACFSLCAMASRALLFSGTRRQLRRAPLELV